MQTITFTNFRKHASSLLTAVEQGERFIIIRHGRPIAEIIPYDTKPDKMPAWQQNGLRLQIEGADLAEVIMAERDIGE